MALIYSRLGYGDTTSSSPISTCRDHNLKNMTFSKSLHFVPREFELGELKRCFQTALKEVFPQDATVSIHIRNTLQDGTQHATESKDLDELSKICDLSAQETQIQIVFYARPDLYKAGFDAMVLVSVSSGDIVMSFMAATSDCLTSLIGSVVGALRLQKSEKDSISSPPSFWDDLDALQQRVAVLEKARDAQGQRLTCFLSLRFEEKSRAYAEKLKKLLALLHVGVITGEGYEPKTIQSKVSGRLDQGIDFHIMLITANGQSTWQRDEMAKTQGTKGTQDTKVFLILLLEDGAEFEQGIYGDHEFIPFPKGRIAEAFLPLLEGIRYIERSRINGMENGS